ncbi:hypothetical protein GCM10022255_068020 [Dactylosporangium darangshiense]|uniref:Uncharacterized protein n=2 Tax=Dactylosporangium darangshiense TaxID=579108 RepID=A0ABP8DHS6_9ACTN
MRDGDRPGIQVNLHPLGGVLTLAGRVWPATPGGFATYGATRLVWEMYSDRALDMPAAWPLIDAGISFKSARGLPMESLSGYELQRLGRRVQDRELRRLRPE